MIALPGVPDFLTEEELVIFLHNFGISVAEFENLECFTISFTHGDASFSLHASYSKSFTS